MNLNWWLHSLVRHAAQMRKHVIKLINAQRDLLAPAAVAAMESAVDELRRMEVAPFRRELLQAEMVKVEKAANKWLKPYPSASLRENVEVLLVAIALAMGIRTFFLQPFKIPTGSMQPTLFGITHDNLIDQPEEPIPSRWNPFRFLEFWYDGVGYTHVAAKRDGEFRIIDEKPTRFLLFNLRQRFSIGGETHTVWFPPESLWDRAGLAGRGTRQFRRGEDVIRLRTVSGDHLFVDRLTYNFRRPRRGEIIVFETRGIGRGRYTLPNDQYYIKRLVALGGETVRLGNDRHIIINRTNRMDASTPHFEMVYSRPGRPEVNRYSGHVNQAVAEQYGYMMDLADLFRDERAEVKLPPRHYMVMGDNTLSSYDSRAWGSFPRENVIGRSFFVYWPIGSQPGRAPRFGWGHR